MIPNTVAKDLCNVVLDEVKLESYKSFQNLQTPVNLPNDARASSEKSLGTFLGISSCLQCTCCAPESETDATKMLIHEALGVI